jgi:transposase
LNVENVVTAAEIRSRAGVSAKTINNMCRQWKREGLAKKSGRTWLIDRKTAEDYIAQNPKT